jgi:hypothetical protein
MVRATGAVFVCPRAAGSAHTSHNEENMDDKVPVKSLIKIVDYMARDEWRHFQEMQDAGEDTSDHIHHSVQAVGEWLESQGVDVRGAIDAMWAEYAKEATSRVLGSNLYRLP